MQMLVTEVSRYKLSRSPMLPVVGRCLLEADPRQLPGARAGSI